MSKQPKTPKGGARRQRPQPARDVPTISAHQMFKDSRKYRHLYHKTPVKTPEDMPVNPAFLSQIDILKLFADMKIDAPVFEKYAGSYANHQTYEECMELSHDNNLMVLLEALSIATQWSDLDDPYDRGWINLLKAIVALYQGNPYTRDRIGWFMWEIGKHIYPRCYFPLTLDMYYDPRLWHRPGEYPKEPLPIPQSVAFDGQGQIFGPEDDIWDCELPNTG